MKLSDAFLTHDDGDQKLLVSTGTSKFSGLVRSNQTAGFIIECLKTETTEDEIVEKMLKKWDAPDEIIRCDVQKIVKQLKDIGAIDD